MVLKAKADGLLEVLDIGPQTPSATYNTGNVDVCWLCNWKRATKDVGLCAHCYGWCTFEHDEEPKVCDSSGGRVDRFGRRNYAFDPEVFPGDVVE